MWPILASASFALYWSLFKPTKFATALRKRLAPAQFRARVRALLLLLLLLRGCSDRRVSIRRRSIIRPRLTRKGRRNGQRREDHSQRENTTSESTHHFHRTP